MIHLQGFAKILRLWHLIMDKHGKRVVQVLRSTILKAWLEVQREQGVIKHSLEAQIALAITPEFAHAEAFKFSG